MGIHLSFQEWMELPGYTESLFPGHTNRENTQMIKSRLPIYLASNSPRRKKLLEQLNIKFKHFSVDCDEIIEKGETPAHAVQRLSLKKLSLAKAKIKNGIIITADTIVVINGKIIGKPENKKDAERILILLSDKTHARGMSCRRNCVPGETCATSWATASASAR